MGFKDGMFHVPLSLSSAAPAPDSIPKGMKEQMLEMKMKALTSKKQILATVLALAMVVGAVGVIGMSDSYDAEDEETLYIGGTLISGITGLQNQKFVVNQDLVLENGTFIRLNDTNTLTVNEGVTVTLKQNSEFTVNSGAAVDIKGAIVTEGTNALTMNDGSTMTVNGTLTVNGADSMEVKNGATLNVPGILNINKDGSAIYNGTVTVTNIVNVNGTVAGTIILTGGEATVNTTKTGLNAVFKMNDTAKVHIIDAAGEVSITDADGNQVYLKNLKGLEITHDDSAVISGTPIMSDENAEAAFSIVKGVAQIDDMVTKKVIINIEYDAELKVNGALDAKDDNGVPMIKGTGALTVTGMDSIITTYVNQPLTINTKSAPNVGLDFNGVTYADANYNYYVTVEKALQNPAEGSVIKVYGDVVINEDLVIPDDVTLDISEADSLTVAKDVTVTIKADEDAAGTAGAGVGGNINSAGTDVIVNGTIIVEDVNDSTELDADVTSDIALKDGDTLTYTNLNKALGEVEGGETVTLRKDVVLTDDLLIPEKVTLVMDGYDITVSPAATKTVTITVMGTLDGKKADSIVDLGEKGVMIAKDDTSTTDALPYIMMDTFDNIELNAAGTNQPQGAWYSTADADVITSILGLEAGIGDATSDVAVYGQTEVPKDLVFENDKTIVFNDAVLSGGDGIDFGKNKAVFMKNVDVGTIKTTDMITFMAGVDATVIGTISGATPVTGDVTLVNAKPAESQALVFVCDGGLVSLVGNIVKDDANEESSASFGGNLGIIGTQVGYYDAPVNFYIKDGAKLEVKSPMFLISSDLTVPAGTSIDFVSDLAGKVALVTVDGDVVVNGTLGTADSNIFLGLACEDIEEKHNLTVAEGAKAYLAVAGVNGDVAIDGTADFLGLAAAGDVTIDGDVTAIMIGALGNVAIDGDVAIRDYVPTVKEIKDFVAGVVGQTVIDNMVAQLDPEVQAVVYNVYNAISALKIPAAICGNNVDITGTVETQAIVATLVPIDGNTEGGNITVAEGAKAETYVMAAGNFDVNDEMTVFTVEGGNINLAGDVDSYVIIGGDVVIPGTVDGIAIIAVDNVVVDVTDENIVINEINRQVIEDLIQTVIENTTGEFGTVSVAGVYNGSAIVAKDVAVAGTATLVDFEGYHSGIYTETLDVDGKITVCFIEATKSVDIAAKAMVVSKIFNTVNLDLAGELTINGLAGYTSIIEETTSIDGGKLIANDVLVLGHADITNGGALATGTAANVVVDELVVGIDVEDIFQNGKGAQSTGTVGNNVYLDTAGVAYASAGSTIGTGVADEKSTTFYMVDSYYRGVEWFTAYVEDSKVIAINKVVEGTDAYAYVDGWRLTATFPGQIIENEIIGAVENVYQNIRYDIYAVTVVADPAIGGVYIENIPLSKSGNVFFMDSNMSYDANKTSYSVKYNLVNGYTGSVEMYVNGNLRDNFDFVLPENTENLQQIDIKISLTYDASTATGGEGGDEGLTLIEILLIIITAAIIVIGVVVIFRMLRS